MLLTGTLALCLLALDDAGMWLTRLRGADAIERARAETWLGLHLVDDDLERIVVTLADPDAEVEQRIVNALGASDRTLGLAAALASRSEPECARAGRDALRERILAWDPAAEEAPHVQVAALTALREEGGEETVLNSLSGPGAAWREFEDVARRLDPGLELVLDPDLDPHAHLPVAKDQLGPSAALIAFLLRRSGASLVGFGVGDDESASSPLARRWLLVVPPKGELRTNAVQRITSWCVRFQRTREPAPARSACACALGQCGWSAPLAWFERRWREHADECALDGLVAAAGRGRVAPLLHSTDVQRVLFERLDWVAGPIPKSQAVLDSAQAAADALGNAGPSGDLVFQRWSIADTHGWWLLLAILERQGRSTPRALEEIDKLLTMDVRVYRMPLVLQAMRTRAALAPGVEWPLHLLDPTALALWADTHAQSGAMEELVDAWLQSTPLAPEEWRDPDGVLKTRPHAERELAFVAWFARGEYEIAAKHAIALLEPTEASIESVAKLVRTATKRLTDREREHFAAALRATPGGDPAARALLALFARLDEHPDVGLVRAWTLDPSPTRARILALGALAAGEHGAAARARLIALISSPTKLSDELDRARDEALREAIHQLRLARVDAELESFVLAVRAAARVAEDTRVRLYASEHWPVPAASPAEPVVRSVRRLELAGF